jgi:hypothetical protein
MYTFHGGKLIQSLDAGQAFGPVVMLGTNGTISTTITANNSTATAVAE